MSQWAVLIPLFAGFVTPSTPPWALIFYLTAIPSIFLSLWRGWRPDWKNPALVAMLCLWGWTALTIAWNHEFDVHGKSSLYWVVNALWTLILVLNFVCAAEAEPRARDRVMLALIYGGAINALISVGLFLIKGDYNVRLWGWGLTGNPVMGAAIMDICLLLALNRIRSDLRQRLPVMIACLPILAFLVLCYSRSALLAACVVVVVLAFGKRPLAAALVFACVIAGGWVFWNFGQTFAPTLWDNLASRGDDCHVQLWQAAWRAIHVHPILGYGPSATLPHMDNVFCTPYPVPHSLYLSILYFSGAIGLGLFVATVLLLGRHLLAATHGFSRRLWLCVGLVPLIVGLTDLVQIIKGPSVMWYIFWVPMLFVVTLPKNEAL
ncbi:MAG: O-antigen ligase family protein [Rhodospirillales bacterium]|nr:O-antigen ligase family protein [Rhodospirillales bacterium]